MKRITIFSYGSNMCSTRLRARTPSARLLGVARLDRYQIRFHKTGQDGSAKANALASDAPGAALWGVLWEILREEKAALDRAEGLGNGYDECMVRVTARDGTVYDARMYVAQAGAIDESRRPFSWYTGYVLAGALEHGLPDAWVETLRAIPARPDPDAARHAMHCDALGISNETP